MLTVEPQVVEQYVRPGKVRLIFHPVLNFGERSERATEAAVSAGEQGQFWQMHSLLYQEQPTVEQTANGDLVRLMRDFAARLTGLDQAAFARSMETRATFPAIKAAEADQRKRGITSQPIFEIGTQRLFGLQSFEVLQRTLDAALKS